MKVICIGFHANAVQIASIRSMAYTCKKCTTKSEIARKIALWKIGKITRRKIRKIGLKTVELWSHYFFFFKHLFFSKFGIRSALK